MKKAITIIFISLLLQVWNVSGQNWQSIGNLNNLVWTLTEYNGDLYAGGWFGIGTDSCIAKWDGSNWVGVGGGLNGGGAGYIPWSSVNSMAVFNSELYVAGDFKSAGGIPVNGIAKWNGITWSQVGSGMNHDIGALTVYNNQLYACGGFDTAGGVYAERIARWDGTNWWPVGGGITTGTANCITTLNNELYVGGAFGTVGGSAVNYIAKWNGSNWSDVGNGFDNVPNALAVYNNAVYAGGYFLNASGFIANHIAKWNGTLWESLGNGLDDKVNSLIGYNGNLYAGGIFKNADGISVNNIAKWDNSSWSDVSAGITSTNCSTCASVNAFTVYNGALIVGGGFTTAGSISANNIVKWYLPTGISEIYNKVSVECFPNPVSQSQELHFKISDIKNNSKIKVEIVSILGEVLKSFYVNNTINEDLKIKINDLQSGLYYSVITTDDKLYYSSFVFTKE